MPPIDEGLLYEVGDDMPPLEEGGDLVEDGKDADDEEESQVQSNTEDIANEDAKNTERDDEKLVLSFYCY